MLSQLAASNSISDCPYLFLFITLVPFVVSSILATGTYTVKLATQHKFSKGNHNLI